MLLFTIYKQYYVYELLYKYILLTNTIDKIWEALSFFRGHSVIHFDILLLVDYLNLLNV